MFSDLISFFKFGRKYYCIEVLSGNNLESYRVASTVKKDGEFKNPDFSVFRDSKDILSEIPKNRHCYLSINTKNVLWKEIVGSYSAEEALTQAFPSINKDDFYFEVIGSGEAKQVFIAKRDYIDSLINMLFDLKISVIGFNLGVPTLMAILPVIKQTVIVIPNMSLQVLNNSIVKIHSSDTESISYDVEGSAIRSENLISTAGIVGYLSPPDIFGNTLDQSKNLRRRYLEKNFFRKSFILMLGFILLVAILNMMVNLSLQKEYGELQEAVQMKSLELNEFRKLENEVSSKEKIVQTVLKNSVSNSSYYIDRLVSLTPRTILFDEITYQPLEKNIRADKKINVAIRKIQLRGVSSNKVMYSQWIEDLEQLDWISNVMVMEYGMDSKNTDVFSIVIDIKDDL